MNQRRKSPQLKKLDEYDRESRTAMENPHAFRKNWPKKKARANRAGRVKLRVQAAAVPADEMTAGAVKAAIRGRAIRKSGVTSVRDLLWLKVERRAQRAGRKVGRDGKGG